MHENPGVWKKGVRLKFTIEGKIAWLGLNDYMEVWATGVREIRVNNGQKKNPRAHPRVRTPRSQSSLNEKGQPAEYLPTSQNSQE